MLVPTVAGGVDAVAHHFEVLVVAASLKCPALIGRLAGVVHVLAGQVGGEEHLGGVFFTGHEDQAVDRGHRMHATGRGEVGLVGGHAAHTTHRCRVGGTHRRKGTGAR